MKQYAYIKDNSVVDLLGFFTDNEEIHMFLLHLEHAAAEIDRLTKEGNLIKDGDNDNFMKWQDLFIKRMSIIALFARQNIEALTFFARNLKVEVVDKEELEKRIRDG